MPPVPKPKNRFVVWDVNVNQVVQICATVEDAQAWAASNGKDRIDAFEKLAVAELKFQ